jgi:hypothetical protein
MSGLAQAETSRIDGLKRQIAADFVSMLTEVLLFILSFTCKCLSLLEKLYYLLGYGG